MPKLGTWLSSDYIGTIFAQTATVTVSNTTTETTLTGSGSGTLTLPANFFIAGKTIRVTIFGITSTAASPAAEQRLRLKLGSTTVLDGLGGSSFGPQTNERWQAYATITCRTTGATGTVFAQGYTDLTSNIGSAGQWVNTGTQTIDTTGTLAVELTVDMDQTGTDNSVSVTNLVVEALN